MPYYFYMCDMIPGSGHWRLTLAEGQALQEEIMGYLPGFATPRMVCDVPYYDPIYMLPEAGQAWWRTERSQPRADSGEVVSLANATG